MAINGPLVWFVKFEQLNVRFIIAPKYEVETHIPRYMPSSIYSCSIQYTAPLCTVNKYMQVTGMATGENFAFFIYRHFVEIL